MTRISGSCELASSNHRRIKLRAGNDSRDGVSLRHNFNNQRTRSWFLRFQIVHRRRVVPELANEQATFLTVHAVDSGVEAIPKERKLERVRNSADGYSPL